MAAGAVSPAAEGGNPFDLADEQTYRRWREWKLDVAPSRAEDLVVEVEDPAEITPAEHTAMLDRLRRANMVLYVTRHSRHAAKETLRRLGRRFGLNRLDSNLCADGDGLTPLQVVEDGRRTRYIPYTDKAIKWHTDGYYNTAENQIRGLILHCVRQAAEGGFNQLMDHEIAYILLRDHDPRMAEALYHPQAMSVPPNDEGGQEIRGERPGPVFSIDSPTGSLHMRYTMRTRNIVWRDDPTTRAAVALLETILNQDSPYVFRHRMAPGHGLVCNNVLHDRSAFRDGPEPDQRRLIYRGRYFDRVAGTAPHQVFPT